MLKSDLEDFHGELWHSGIGIRDAEVLHSTRPLSDIHGLWRSKFALGEAAAGGCLNVLWHKDEQIG